MSFLEEYKQKLVSADEAVKIVKSGDWVDYGWCTGTPDALDKALARRTDELKDVNVRGGILLKPLAIFEREDAGEHFTWNSWHMGGYERKLIKRGCSFYSPIRYSELPRYYRDSTTPDDVAMFQVAPMDSHGYFNFGPNASHLGAVCETSKKIIVEVNENMPRCHGGSEANVHISQVSYIVEGDNPAIGELGAGGPATDVDKKVAELIVDQIPNGACLQLGIGGMPNAVGSLIAESDLKDLGVHTEMYVDAFVDIAKAGKITGAKKNIDRYRQAYGFGAGTKKMYDYLDENPELMSAPVSYTNDIKNIAALDNFISINNCVDLDLFGQISSESSGTKHISGAGGQLDFVLGAYMSNGGKSFICCSSTFTDKQGVVHSRIRPTLVDGSVVTDTRANTHYIVTEYGMVNVKGLSTWQKAEAIISVAHPDFRGVISPEDIAEVEHEVNVAISKNIPIEVTYPSRDELAQLEYRSKIEIEGQVRIVTVPGYDVCACCAPHVKRTGEIGMLKVMNYQNYKGGVRISILCGFRALEAFRQKCDIISELMGIFTTNQEAIVDNVTKLKAVNQSLKSELGTAKSALLDYKVAELPADTDNAVLFEDGIDTNTARNCVNGLVEKYSGFSAFFTGNDEAGYSFIIGSKNADCNTVAAALRNKLGARGGGKPVMVQGSVKAAKSEIEEVLKEVL